MDTLETILAKVEAIREDQIRGLERVNEIREALRQPIQATAQPAQPSKDAVSAPTRMNWAWAGKASVWFAQTFWKHLPTLGGLIYLKATGQDEKITAYIGSLFGL